MKKKLSKLVKKLKNTSNSGCGGNAQNSFGEDFLWLIQQAAALGIEKAQQIVNSIPPSLDAAILEFINDCGMVTLDDIHQELWVVPRQEIQGLCDYYVKTGRFLESHDGNGVRYMCLDFNVRDRSLFRPIMTKESQMESGKRYIAAAKKNGYDITELEAYFKAAFGERP